MHSLNELKVAVVGLGYVGLPLAVEFSKHRPVVGFDINNARISALREGRDVTLEISDEELAAATGMKFTSRYRGDEGLQRVYRHRPDADRRLQASRLATPDRRQRNHRQRAEEERHRHL